MSFKFNSADVHTDGRYMIINISVENANFCIASIFGPNVDDPSFFHAFFALLSAHSNTTLIIGGDFNLIYSPELDRSSSTGNHRDTQAAGILKQYKSDFGLCDAWRSYHPTLREYTYFSPVHHSYSQIDYFFTSSSILVDIFRHPDSPYHNQ